MIAKENNIWGFKSPLIAGTLPSPFEGMTNKQVQIKDPCTAAPARATIINGVIKAALIMAALQEEAAGHKVDFTDCHKGVAIGTKTNKAGGETVYVEKESQNRRVTDIVKYNPSTGTLNGVFFNSDTGRATPYKIKGAGGTDGTAIFLALFEELLRHSGAMNDDFDQFKMHLQNSVLPDILWEDVARLSYLSYKILTEDSIPLDLGKETELKTIPTSKIKGGQEGPSKGKVTYGDFKVLKVGSRKSSAEELKALDEKLKQAGSLPFERTEKDFTAEELSMIPSLDKTHVVSFEEKFIISEIVDTFNDPLNAVRTVMLLGQSSSGKSHMAKTLAARMKRPFSAPLTCTPNMDETTLLGTTLPVIDGAGRDCLSKEENLLLDKLYSASEDETEEVIQDALGLPDADSILYDPEGAFEELTGKRRTNITSSEVIRASQFITGRKIKELSEKLPHEEGVRYMYYKSPLVRAIENGWMIEIQEFNVCKEAAIFTSLNNVFDKDANGILETPYGQVFRHPDFRAIYTANPEYAGCKDPHQSVIARADMVVTMNNPAEEVMQKRIKARMNFDNKDLLADVVSTFMLVCTRASEISCNGEATMRELYRFANAINRDVSPRVALENYVLNSITRDEEEKAELFEAAAEGGLV